jgi:hypothetical protein
MKSNFLIILFGCLTLFSSCSGRNDKKTAINPETALMENLDSFKRTKPVKTYDKDNLWKYIDGAADKYVELGFEKLAAADYAKDSLELTIEIYAFSSSSGPLAIYQNNKAPDERTFDITDEGFVTEGLLMFRDRNIFVQITCYNPDTDDAQLIRLARAIEQNLKFK